MHEKAKTYLQMLELSHYSYLVSYAADRVSVEYPEAISAAVPIAIGKLSRDREAF